MESGLITMISSRFTVSIHVPKTAGTTVADVFSRIYKRRIIFDYDDYLNPEIASDSVRENSAFIENYFSVMHGHFFGKKYFDVFPNAMFVATLRHPVDRVISQYIHEYNDSTSEAFFHRLIHDDHMSVVDFAQEPGIGNALAIHLEGRLLADYDLLMISEDLVRSLAIYSKLVGDFNLEGHFGHPIALPRLNEGNIRPKNILFDQKTREAIYNATSEDNEVYKEAMSLFTAKVKAFL